MNDIKSNVEGSWVKMLASRRWKVDSSRVGILNDVVDWENACPRMCVMAWDKDLDWWEKNCWLFGGSDDVERHCSTMSLVLCTELLETLHEVRTVEVCTSSKCLLAKDILLEELNRRLQVIQTTQLLLQDKHFTSTRLESTCR